MTFTADSSWRKYAAPIIAETIREMPDGATDKDLRRALRDAYPFGERKYWPYKVWCDEVRRQLGKKKPTATAVPRKNDDPRQAALL